MSYYRIRDSKTGEVIYDSRVSDLPAGVQKRFQLQSRGLEEEGRSLDPKTELQNLASRLHDKSSEVTKHDRSR